MLFRLPCGDGVELEQRLRQAAPVQLVVINTQFDSDSAGENVSSDYNFELLISV